MVMVHYESLIISSYGYTTIAFRLWSARWNLETEAHADGTECNE